METAAFVLDILIVIATVAAYFARPRIGGELAKGLRILTMGLVVLGFAHLIETLLFVIFKIETPLNEVMHRLLVAGGLVLVIIGFARMRKAFDG